MDVVSIGEIESWPQAVVAVTLIVAVWVLPEVLRYLRDRQPVAKVEAARHEQADTSAPAQQENTNWFKAILRKFRDALNRRVR
jgi:hypothetical protein